MKERNLLVATDWTIIANTLRDSLRLADNLFAFKLESRKRLHDIILNNIIPEAYRKFDYDENGERIYI